MDLLKTTCIGLDIITSRSGNPTELNFPFLEQLRLKCIVYLAPDEPSVKLVNFCDDNDISLHLLSQKLPSLNTWDPISEDVVLEALNIILHDEYPLLIMCNLGRHRTGTSAS